MPVAQPDLNMLLKMERLLRKKPRTVQELMELLKVSNSTVYRYLERLDQENSVYRVGYKRPTKYTLKEK